MRITFCELLTFAQKRTKSFAKRNSAPVAGCFCNIIPFRHSAIHTECFLPNRRNFLFDKKIPLTKNKRHIPKNDTQISPVLNIDTDSLYIIIHLRYIIFCNKIKAFRFNVFNCHLLLSQTNQHT